MTINNKFDAIVKTIVANSQTEIDIKNELVYIFNGNKTYQFQDGTIFNRDYLIEIMIDTIFEYQDETKSYVRSLKEKTLETINDFDDAFFMVSDYDNNQIKNLIYNEPKFTSLVIDGLIEIYYKNKDLYFRTNQRVDTNNNNNNNDQEYKVDYTNYENAERSKNNLKLLDEALSKTQKKGTIGRAGYVQGEYSDEQITFILTDLMKGSYKYITNSPLGEENKLRDKISKVSRNEIFAEVLKNAIRVISMANNERDLVLLTSYNIMPLDIQKLSGLVTDLTCNSLNDSNIDSVIDNLGPNEMHLLSKMFILSRKDDLIKDKLLNATMGDKYHILLINSLNKIGSSQDIGEDNFSK